MLRTARTSRPIRATRTSRAVVPTLGLAAAALALTACSGSVDVEVTGPGEDAGEEAAAPASYADFFEAAVADAIRTADAFTGDYADVDALTAEAGFDTGAYAFATPSTSDGIWCVESLEEPFRSATAATDGENFGIFFDDLACGDVVPEETPVALGFAFSEVEAGMDALRLVKGDDPELEAKAQELAAEYAAQDAADPTAAVVSDVQAVAVEVETFFVDQGAYPLDLAEAEAVAPPLSEGSALRFYELTPDQGAGETYVLCVDDGTVYAIWDSAFGDVVDAGEGTC